MRRDQPAAAAFAAVRDGFSKNVAQPSVNFYELADVAKPTDAGQAARLAELTGERVGSVSLGFRFS